MRASLLVSASFLFLASCAAPADPGATGPGTSTPALVDFTASSITMGGVELQQSVSVLVRNERGEIISNAPVTWSSDNPTVATVTGNGTTASVVSHAAGSATIRANAGSAASQVPVRVLGVGSVTVGQAAVSVRARDALTVTATVQGEAGALRTVQWSSQNPAVATVSAQGLVTGVSVGTTTLRANASADPKVGADVAVTVTAGRLVTLTPSALTLWIGDADTLRATPEVLAGQSPDVAFASDDPTVATVNSRGAVVAVGVGTTTLRATSLADPRVVGSASIRVHPARAVSISPATSTLNTGTTRTLTATVTIEDGLSKAVTWRSSNPAIVTVSQAGVATGVSLGTVSITAVSVADTTRKASATITVTPVVRDVSVSPGVVTIFPLEDITVEADVDAQGSLSRAVTWRSANPTVATVTADGTITGVAAGQTVVTALSLADTTKRAQVAVTVRPSPEIAVFPTQAVLASGDQRMLVASVNIEGGLSTAVTWRSSNSAVASVSQAGLVTAVSLGSATITAVSVADTNRKASSAISVRAVVRSLSLTPTSASIYIAQGVQLTGTVVADAGLSTQVVWRTSNAAVATVSATGYVTGVAPGSATVTAVSVGDTTKKALSFVTVASRPVSVTIQQTGLALNLGQSGTLNATVSGDPGVSQAVSWMSSNPAVATVNAAGVVTAVSQGTTTITAASQADASKSASVAVVVASRLVGSWSASRAGGALYEDIGSIVAVDANSAFAVNVVGDVFRWDGSSWNVSARGTTYGTKFIAVHGTSASNMIAVGRGGVVARYNGSSWSPMTSNTTADLLDIFVESSSTAFASGANGTVIRLSGSAWTLMNTGTSQTLNGVWSSSGSAVAVGTGGEVLRLVSGAWVRQNSPTVETLYSVTGVTNSNIVAVGSFGTVLRFDGTNWTTANSNGTTADLYAVDGSFASGAGMFVASDAGLMQFDGTSLTTVNTPYRPQLFSVSADISGNVWAGGQRGAVFRGASGVFTTNNLAPDLLDVYSTAANNAWAVGEFGFIYRFDGSSWTRQTTPTTARLNAVWAASATDAFVGGDNGTMLHWNGTTWLAMSVPSSSSIYSVWGSSGSNVYAVTADGLVFRYNGTAWSSALTGAGALWSVSGSASTNVLVSGENGRVMRFDGSGWNTLSPSASGTWSGIWAGSASSVMAVGEDVSGTGGIASRFDGTQWQSQSVGTTAILTSVWGPSASDLYVTGELGTILRYNGTTWQTMSSGTTEYLWGLTGAPGGAGGAFAVGYNGTIVSGSAAGGFSTAAMRAFTRTSLEPSAQARRDPRGFAPIPEGAARRMRRPTDKLIGKPGRGSVNSIKFRKDIRR